MDLELGRCRINTLLQELGGMIDSGKLSELELLEVNLKMVDCLWFLADMDEVVHVESKLAKLKIQAASIEVDIQKAQERYSRALDRLASRGL